MRTHCILIAILLPAVLNSNDMVNDLSGEIHSSIPIRRVFPVRYTSFHQEIWLNNLPADGWKPNSIGKDADLTSWRNGTVLWSWVLSYSGGRGGSHGKHWQDLASWAS